MAKNININNIDLEEMEGGFQKNTSRAPKMGNRQDSTRSKQAKAESASRRYSDEQVAAKKAANKKIAAQKAADNRRAVIAKKRENSGLDKKSSYSFSGRNDRGRR